jgi:hypothetical protein
LGSAASLTGFTAFALPESFALTAGAATDFLVSVLVPDDLFEAGATVVLAAVLAAGLETDWPQATTGKNAKNKRKEDRRDDGIIALMGLQKAKIGNKNPPSHNGWGISFLQRR